MYGEINGIPLTDVSCTMLLTLYGRVVDCRSDNPVLQDPKGIELAEQLSPALLKSTRKLLRNLGGYKMNQAMAVHTALRAKQYDLYTEEFVRQHPGCTVVNLGCGLDTRFWRIDNGQLQFFDLDLPEVIKLKQTLLQETDRYKMLACSVLDHNWMDTVLAGNRPVLLMAEGLFMYLPKTDVKTLVAALATRIQQGQLIAEVVTEKYTRGINRKMVGFKFKHEMGFGQPIYYNCGIADSNELESWSPRLHLIDDWTYFDADPQKLGWMSLFRYIKAFRKVQWTVRYRIGD